MNVTVESISSAFLSSPLRPHPAEGRWMHGLDNYDKSVDLLKAYWEAVESLDADLVASHFVDSAQFHFGHNSPLRGRSAIRRGFVGLFAEVASIRHVPATMWSRGGVVVNDANVAFTLENGGKTMLPITTIVWTKRSKILACRLLFYPEPALALATRGFQPILEK
jgi:ketosteroid isomerase-like protein